MGRARLLMTGVFLNWIPFAVAVVVTFFLSPFVVRHLGSATYGVWILSNSSIAYMALLDLGMRGAITQFVAKYHALGQHLESSQAISAAMGFRLVISLMVMIVSLALAALATRIFRIPVELWTAIRWTMIITGLNLSFTLIVGVFNGVLTGIQRFDVTSSLAVAQVLLGAVGTVAVLEAGHGIVMLALTQVAITVGVGVFTIVFCFRAYPEIRLGASLDRKTLTDLWRYSSYLFIIAITGQFIYYSDNLIVGAFLSAEAVAFYAIGGKFIEYLGQLSSSLAQTFMPVAASLAAKERPDQLRRLLIQGTRLALFVSLPIAWVLFSRSHTFIGLWMGQQYAQTSGKVLKILLLSAVALSGNRVGGNIVLGLGKHKPFAVWQTCEAIANLTLSVYLVRKVGIIGVAWGTVIPSLISQLVLWPRYLSKLLDLAVWSYFWDGWMRPALATLPFGLACFWIDSYWTAPNMIFFFLQILLVLPIIPLGIALLFWKEVRFQLRTPGSLFRSTFFPQT
jgi:O-antigen/teichoic acid export membrane protein